MTESEDRPKKIHSVPVPRLYKVAANILKNFEDGKDSLKNLVFNCKKHPNKKGLFSLVMETQNHKKQLDKVTEKIELFVSEPRFNKHLAYVLINELIWGKQTLPGDSLPVKTVLRYKKRLKKCIDKDEGVDGRALCDSWPRYARINTLCTNKEQITNMLIEEGWEEVIYNKKEVNNKMFIELISNLKEYQYLSDLHIPILLVFPPKSQLYSHKLVTEGFLMLQDKSSCFPVAALAPPPGSSVLDACAAPGMKTSQLAAAVCGDNFATLGGHPPQGAKVVAIERSTKRYQLLKDILQKSQANLVTEVLNEDFLKIDPNMHSDVEYIVLDPSCSGTGMARRGGGDEDPSEERLENLASVQTSLLLHALSFPSVKRVVYSTCAVSVVENEAVVSKVLEKLCGWSVANIMPAWERRGMEEFTDGPKFVRALAGEDMCNGFFVAVLERNGNIKNEKTKIVLEDDKDLCEEISETHKENLVYEIHNVKKTKKKKKLKDDSDNFVDSANVPDDSNVMGRKKKKKTKEKSPEIDSNSIQKTCMSENITIKDAIENINECELTDKEHKKKKKRKTQEVLEESNDLCEEDEDVKRPKKRKRDKLIMDKEELIQENELSEKKHKKKKKKSHEDSEESMDLCKGNENVERNSKKKKRDKVLLDENDSTKENEEYNEKLKKKKRKKDKVL